jgi:competence protein ComEC
MFPGFASRRPVKKYAAGAALAALAVYLFISGMAVAAERSFLMIGIMLLAVRFDRAAISMRNLALSAIVIIAVSPHEVAGPSFQMSFAATAALIGGYAAWSERRRRRPAVTGQGLLRAGLGKAGGYVGGLAATSLIAGSATAVFGAYHFQRVSVLGLAANLAAMPIVSVLVMPFALLGMVLMPFGLDQWAFAVMGKGLTAMIAVARWFSALSPVDSVGLVPASGVLALTAALIAATLPTTWLRLVAIPIALAGVVLIATRSLPGVLVSEDGRQVAVRMADGAIAVNRARPNLFTTEDWQRALAAEAIVKPKDVGAGEVGAAGGEGFRCSGDACAARTPTGSLVAHAANAAAARPFCASASLIVIDDATAENPCLAGGSAIITKRDLARRGAAAISLAGVAQRGAVAITYAIEQPYRPWHAQRAFSRAARGLPPYERKKQHSAVRNAAKGGGS